MTRAKAKTPAKAKAKAATKVKEEEVVSTEATANPPVSDEGVEDTNVATPNVDVSTEDTATDADDGEGTDATTDTPTTPSDSGEGTDDSTTDTDDAEGVEEEVVAEETVPPLQYPDAVSVAAYLITPNVSVKEKLATLSTEADLGISMLVKGLLEYAEEFGPGKPECDGDVVVGKLYGIYNVIKGVVETPDSAEFAVKMDILNLVFREYGEPGEAFYPTMLVRYDYLWKWGDAPLKTHQVLCTLISKLADKAGREEAIKKVNINNQFARTGLSISQDTIERIIRYYS